MTNPSSPAGELRLQNHYFNGRHDAATLDPAIAEEMAFTMQPNLYAQLEAETIASALDNSPTAELDTTSENGKKIQSYLDEQKAQDIDRDVGTGYVTTTSLAHRLQLYNLSSIIATKYGWLGKGFTWT